MTSHHVQSGCSAIGMELGEHQVELLIIVIVMFGDAWYLYGIMY